MKVDSRFHCFACQADGDVIDFVGRLFQLSPYKAAEKLKEDFGMALADGKVRLAPRRPPTVRQQLLDYYRCLPVSYTHLDVYKRQRQYRPHDR